MDYYLDNVLTSSGFGRNTKAHHPFGYTAVLCNEDNSEVYYVWGLTKKHAISRAIDKAERMGYYRV